MTWHVVVAALKAHTWCRRTTPHARITAAHAHLTRSRTSDDAWPRPAVDSVDETRFVSVMRMRVCFSFQAQRYLCRCKAVPMLSMIVILFVPSLALTNRACVSLWQAAVSTGGAREREGALKGARGREGARGGATRGARGILCNLNRVFLPAIRGRARVWLRPVDTDGHPFSFAVSGITKMPPYDHLSGGRKRTRRRVAKVAKLHVLY